MMKTSVVYTLLSSIPMFVCGFWAIVFGVHFGRLPLNKRLLCVFMVVATSLYFGHFVVFNHLYSFIPVTDTLYSLATLSVYPLFLLYIISLTGKLRWRDTWLLLPGVLIAAVIGICYIWIPSDLLYDFVIGCHYEERFFSVDSVSRVSLLAHRLMKPVIAFQVVFVLISGYRKLVAFKRKVEDFYSNVRHKDMSEIRHLLVYLVITSCLSVVADLIGRAFFIDSMFLMILVLTPFSIMLFAIGDVGYHQQFTVADLLQEMKGMEIMEEAKEEAEEQENKVEPQKVGGMKTEQRRQLMVEMDRLMKVEHLFLQENLKLSDLAEHLHTNRTYVYEALKLMESEGVESFSDYVNRYRVDYSLQLLRETPKISIEQLSFACGFASKTAFYTNFKKKVGVTPRQYILSQYGQDKG